MLFRHTHVDTSALCVRLSLLIQRNRLQQMRADASARVQADLADKAMHEPPRLGRHRFQGERPQVLASDDVTGSLRALRTVPAVAKDRFKSLQKRGVIQVRVTTLSTVTSWPDLTSNTSRRVPCGPCPNDRRVSRGACVGGLHTLWQAVGGRGAGDSAAALAEAHNAAGEAV